MSPWPSSSRMTKNTVDKFESRLYETEKKLDMIFHWIQKKYGDVLPAVPSNSNAPYYICVQQPSVTLEKLDPSVFSVPCDKNETNAETPRSITPQIVRVQGSRTSITSNVSTRVAAHARNNEAERQSPVPVGRLARSRTCKQTFKASYASDDDQKSSESDIEVKPDIDIYEELSDPLYIPPVVCHDLDLSSETVATKTPSKYNGTPDTISISETTNVVLKTRKPKSVQRIHKCPHQECTEEFRTAKAMQVHRKTHPKPTIVCTECPRTFTEQINLLAHYKSVHPGVKISDPCTICGKTITRKNMVDHMRIHSSKCDFKCEECGKEFKFVQSFKRHQAMHLGIKKQCNICGLMISLNSLKPHMSYMHEKVRAYTCDKCGVSFKSNGALKYHIRTHDNPNTKKRGLNKDRIDFVRPGKKRQGRSGAELTTTMGHVEAVAGHGETQFGKNSTDDFGFTKNVGDQGHKTEVLEGRCETGAAGRAGEVSSIEWIDNTDMMSISEIWSTHN